MNAKPKFPAIAIVVIFLSCNLLAMAGDSASDAFLSTLTTPVAISSFAINPDHYSGLSKEQMQNVLSAKNVFCSFFQALEAKEKNVSQFLAPDYPKRTLGPEVLRRRIVSDETSITQIGISDFETRSTGLSLEFDFYAVTISEGSFNIGTGKAKMTKKGNEWLVSSIKINP